MFNEICRVVGIVVITHYVVDTATKAIEKYVANKQEKEAVADVQ